MSVPPQESLANTDLNEERSVGADATTAPTEQPSPHDAGAAARQEGGRQEGGRQDAERPTAAEMTDGSAPPSPPDPEEAAAQSTDASYDEDATGDAGDVVAAASDGFSPIEATQSGDSGYTSEAGSGGEGAFGTEAAGSDAGFSE